MNTTKNASTGLQELPRVRQATIEDFHQIISMGKELHAENGLMPLAVDKIEETAMKGINHDGGVIGVIGAVGNIEAMIHLVIAQYWYSHDLHLEELYNFVRPQFRRSNNAKALIEYAKRCSERMDVPLLIGIVSNQRTEQKVKLYQRRLGEPSGAYFLYNAKTGG